MKSLRRSFKLLSVVSLLIGLLLCAIPSAAQGSISISPAELTLNTTRGQTLSRTLLIRSDTALAGIQLVPLDLQDAETGSTLPSSAIQVMAAPSEVNPGTPISIQLRFDLSQVPSGQYSGELLLSYAGGSRGIPARVAVKDRPWLPLAALVGGVALGIGVSTYRARGRPRDEVMVRLGQIRTQMKVDEELQGLGQPFARRIEAALTDVEMALESQQWAHAQEASAKADAVWLRWRRGRPDWIEQLKAYGHLMDRLRAQGTDSYYVAELVQAAEDVYHGAPDLEEPQTFRDGLEPLIKKTNTYLALQTRLEVLERLGPRGRAQAEGLRRQVTNLAPIGEEGTLQIAALEGQIEDALLKLRQAELLSLLRAFETQAPDEATIAAASFRERIEALTTGADTAYLELRTELYEARQSAAGQIAEDIRLEGAFGMPFGADRGGAAEGSESESHVRLLATLPGVRIRSLEQAAVAAQNRLRWFTALTYAIAVALLALAGFVELYATRPNFGANGVGDYFALLAWGFGAEATRSAIADMVQSWGLVRR